MMGFFIVVSLIALGFALAARKRVEQLENRLAELEDRLWKRDHPTAEPTSRAQIPPPLPPPPPRTEEPISMEEEPHPEPVIASPVEPPARVPSPKGMDASLLRKLHLWPPEGEGTSEVQIASWWATRIGIILGVIAAVFFGVHVSENTPPIFRLIGLAVVGILVFLTGLRLERTVQTFGQILAAGGLAILYVAAVASHSFAPLRVIESPWQGLGLQLLGVIAMAGFAMWKRSEPLASLAMVLGFISCWFSHAFDLYSFTLVGLIFFALMAALLFFRWKWLSPLVIAMIGSYAGYLLLVLTRWSEVPPSIVVSASGLLNLAGIFFAAFYLTHLVRAPLEDRVRAAGILANSSALAVVGLMTSLIVFPDSLDGFYLVLGVVLLTMAGIEFLRPRLEYLCITLFLKATAAFALFVVVAFEGPAEWFAVALQVGILLYALHRTQSVWIERAVVTLWLVAWFLAARDWSFSAGLHLDRLAGVSFVLLQTATLSRYQRWASSLEKSRKWIVVLAILAGILLGNSSEGLQDHAWGLLLWVAVVASVSLLAVALRSWVPCLVSGVGLAILVGRFANLEPRQVFDIPGLLTGFALLAAGFVAAELIRRFGKADSELPGFCRFLALGFSTLVLGLFLGFWGALEHPEIVTQMITYAAWAAVGGVILVAHSWRAEDRIEFRVMIALGLGMALALPLEQFLSATTAPYIDLAFALAGSVVLIAAFRTKDTVPVYTSVVLALVYFWWIIVANPHADDPVPTWHLIVFALAQIALVLLWRFRIAHPAIWASILIAILGWLNVWQARVLDSTPPSSTEFLHLVLFGTSVLISGLIIATAPRERFEFKPTRRLALWAYPISTSAILLPVFAWPDSAAYPIATALWGVTGSAIFLGGLLLRRRAYRVVGLVGLFLCIIRVFVVDLEDTFYRIIAFAAVAVLLLVIGYLYTRFRDLIEEEDG